MWKWNQIIILFFLVPTRQTKVNNISTLGDYMTLKVLERIDTLLLGMERNQESILSNQKNCNKSLLQIKGLVDSTDNVSNRSSSQDDRFKLLKTAREQLKIMKELFGTECPHPKETPIPQARSYLLNRRPFNWPLLPEEEAQIQFNQKLLLEHYRMLQASSFSRNPYYCVPIQQYFTTGNGNINWMLNCTIGAHTNVIVPLPENGTYPIIPGINNNLFYPTYHKLSHNPCFNTLPNHLPPNFLKYPYTGYPCYPLNPWYLPPRNGLDNLLPLPPGHITYPFPGLPKLPVWSQPIEWPAPLGPEILPNPYPGPPAPPFWPPYEVTNPNPHKPGIHPNPYPGPPGPPNPYPGPPAPPFWPPYEVTNPNPQGPPAPPSPYPGPATPGPLFYIPKGVDLSNLQNLNLNLVGKH